MPIAYENQHIYITALTYLLKFIYKKIYVWNVFWIVSQSQDIS